LVIKKIRSYTAGKSDAWERSRVTSCHRPEVLLENSGTSISQTFGQALFSSCFAKDHTISRDFPEESCCTILEETTRFSSQILQRFMGNAEFETDPFPNTAAPYS